MPAIRCSASSCEKTEKSGKIFYQCNHCERWWCSDHGHDGKKCPGCGKGSLKK
jgi:hypothetical protein